MPLYRYRTDKQIDDAIDAAIAAAGGGSGDMLAANNLSDLANAATARTNLGVAIGSDVQAYDADLTTWAGVTSSANGRSLVSAADYAAMRTLLDLEAGTDFYSISAADAAFLSAAEGDAAYQPLDADLTTWAGLTPSANAQSLVTAANYAAMRGLLDLEAGTDFLSPAAIAAAYQPLDADLTTWAGLTPSANAQSLVTAANYAAMRGLLDLEAGTDFYSIAAADAAFLSPAEGNAAYQPIDAGLTDIAALAVTDGNIIVGNGTNWVAESGSTARASLGLTIGTHVQAYDADLTTWAGITPSANAQSLVGAANYAAMRTLLDLEAGTDFLSPSAIAAAYQPLDADLTTWAGVTSSANGRSLVSAADYAAMRTLLDLEAGTDFYSKTAADAAFQPLDADLTSIAALTTTAYGRGLLELADETALEATLDTLPNLTSIQSLTVTLADAGADAILGWDDSASAYENLTAAEATAVLNEYVGASAGVAGTKGLVNAASAGDQGKFFRGDGTWQTIGGGGDLLAANNLSELTATASTARANLGLTIGTHVQAYDAQLDTWSGVTPSANGQSLVSAADYAAMKALLDVESGTDFLSPAAIAAAYQPLDADLTSWAGVSRAAGFDTFAGASSSANLRSLLTDETGTGAAVFADAPQISTIELGHATDTTISRLAAGLPGVEGRLIPGTLLFRLNAALAGANVNTVQKIFGVGVTLAASTVYAFQIEFTLTKSAGTTSHQVGISFGGTATLNNFFYTMIHNQTAIAPASVSAIVNYTTNSAANVNLTGAITTASTHFRFRIAGTVSINASGTFIPQYTLTAAPGGAYSTVLGSYIEMWPIGASGADTNVGSWA